MHLCQSSSITLSTKSHPQFFTVFLQYWKLAFQFLFGPIKEIAYSFMSYFGTFWSYFLLRRGNTHWKYPSENPKLFFPTSLLKIPGTALEVIIKVLLLVCPLEIILKSFLVELHDTVTSKVNLVLTTRRKNRITVDSVVFTSEHMAYQWTWNCSLCICTGSMRETH